MTVLSTSPNDQVMLWISATLLWATAPPTIMSELQMVDTVNTFWCQKLLTMIIGDLYCYIFGEFLWTGSHTDTVKRLVPILKAKAKGFNFHRENLFALSFLRIMFPSETPQNEKNNFTGWFFLIVCPKKWMSVRLYVNPSKKVLRVRIFEGSGT